METRLLGSVFLVMFLLFGCAGIGRTVPATPAGQMDSEKETTYQDRKLNSYYYFSAAQHELRNNNLKDAVSYMEDAVSHDPKSVYLKMELAFLYLAQKENEKAAELMKKAVEAASDHPEALILYGKIEQEQKNILQAKNAFEKAMRLNPGEKSVYLILGDLYTDENDLENASRVYSSLVEKFPEYYGGHFFMGRVHVKKGNVVEGEKSFLKSIDLEPELDEARYELIEMYKSSGKAEKAIAMYKGILEKNPASIRSAMELGYFFHEMGNDSEAKRIFMELGHKSSSDEEIVRQVFRLFLDQKKYDAAIVVLTGMVKGASDPSDIHYLLGIAYDGIENRDSSMMYMQQVKSGSRFYPNAVVHIAFLFQEQGRVKEAIAFLEEILPRLPDNPDFYLYLGSFYEETGEFTRAEETLKKGLEKDAGNARILFRLGVVYDKWNRKEDSIEAMKQVIRLEPKNASALNYLGYTYADLGRDLEEAERLIKEALKHKPEDGYITDSLGWVYYKKGRYPEALELLLKAISLTPDDPTILEHLGDLYVQMKNAPKALEYYQKSLQLKKKDTAELEKKIQELRGHQ